jgi:hypothetical protein
MSIHKHVTKRNIVLEVYLYRSSQREEIYVIS